MGPRGQHSSAGTNVPYVPMRPASRPSFSRNLTSPGSTQHSPTRHHRRTASGPRKIKETLNASMTQSDQGRMINQFLIKGEIGRGSFGAVQLAEDLTDGKQYAIKEFSKSRLRKRSQTSSKRRPPTLRGSTGGLVQPSCKTPMEGVSQEEKENPLFLIRGEIAIMKKLNHENVVRLIEVLDDPHGDSLYMVLELCCKGVVMKISIDETATPYSEEHCRFWFRDLILGIEYLHSQGIIHRDIKPDNLLLDEENCLKIVDFGVSEIFQKENDFLSKDAGSPAFVAPELCYVKHGNVSGKATDIWSMGVTLYCLYFGRLPFVETQVLDLYEAIKTKEPYIPAEINPDLADLFSRVLEKDPSKRIKMYELREHPWVTVQGDDTLLSIDENTSDEIGPLTEQDLRSAIRGVRGIITVMKAVNKLKRMTIARKSDPQAGAPSLQEFLSRESSANYSDESASETSSQATSRRESFTDERPRLHRGSSNDGREGSTGLDFGGLAKALPVPASVIDLVHPGGADASGEPSGEPPNTAQSVSSFTHEVGKSLLGHVKKIREEEGPVGYAVGQLKHISDDHEFADAISHIRNVHHEKMHAEKKPPPAASNQLPGEWPAEEQKHDSAGRHGGRSEEELQLADERQKQHEERSNYERIKEERKHEQSAVAGTGEEGKRTEEELAHHQQPPSQAKPKPHSTGFLHVGAGVDSQTVQGGPDGPSGTNGANGTPEDAGDAQEGPLYVSKSPTGTAENVFENAWKCEAQRIQEEEGQDVVVFGTWKQEAMSGRAITNEIGREKMEMPEDEEKQQEKGSRWELILDKFELAARQGLDFADAASGQIIGELDRVSAKRAGPGPGPKGGSGAHVNGGEACDDEHTSKECPEAERPNTRALWDKIRAAATAPA